VFATESTVVSRSAFKADVHGLIGKIHFEANQLRKGLKHSTLSKELAMKRWVTGVRGKTTPRPDPI